MRVYGTAPFKNTNKKRGCPRDILAGVGGVEPPITESKSVALPLGYTPMVEGGRFELPNPKERIYSPPRLATSLPLQLLLK